MSEEKTVRSLIPIACNRRMRHPGMEMGRHADERPAQPHRSVAPWGKLPEGQSGAR
jgi:hypothetical protein